MIFFFVLILQEYFVGKALLFLALALKHVYKNEQETQGFSKSHVGFLRVVPFIKFWLAIEVAPACDHDSL